MRGALLSISVLVVASLATPLASPADEVVHFVPCGVLLKSSAAKCASPFIDGVVDGQWVGLVMHFSGGNGGANRIFVVTVGPGGNGELTIALPDIKPEGPDGDRMGAWFARGKLYVTNAVYLPGEAHCCYTNVTVRQFGFHGQSVGLERTATVPSNATKDQIYQALEKATSMF